MENRNIAWISYGGGTTFYNHNDIKSVGVPLSYNVIHHVKWPIGTHQEILQNKIQLARQLLILVDIGINADMHTSHASQYKSLLGKSLRHATTRTYSKSYNNSIIPKIARQHPIFTQKLVHLKYIQGYKRYSLYTLKVHWYQWVYH